IDMIDKALKFEKNARNNRSMKTHLLKIIPAVAVIALMIGIVNMLPALLNSVDIPVIDDPGAYAGNPGEEIKLFLPAVIEKSFFEDKILGAITDKKAFDQMISYYMLRNKREFDSRNITDYDIKEGKIVTYSLAHDTQVYVLDRGVTEREINILFGLLREHTNLTGSDIMQMYEDSGIILIEIPDPYAHVRFGDTREILLLEVEWHTPETYMAEIIEPHKEHLARLEEWPEEWPEVTPEHKLQAKQALEVREDHLRRIEEGSQLTSRLVNGTPHDGSIGIQIDNNGALITPLDPDGYFRFYIYPYMHWEHYSDENGEWQSTVFSTAYSKIEYDRILQEEIIPFYDDLLARGLITQDQYDNWLVKDPLDYYVDMWF
ncbi:MAG: hypothetical protein FWD23_18645, partial [Oscillospiraceae bacterium]|nr:hypothetical protein [Oscillospiraceae bacterium]